MLIKMLKSEKGSRNGISVELFKEGEEYDLEGDLYDVFVNKMKIAKPVPVVEEEKVVTPPSNKAEKPEDDKKDKKKDKKGKKDDEDESEPEEVSNPF